jgi:cytochrome oxidase Cu insertion factor (SCO1/SenC/PrrC family)
MTKKKKKESWKEKRRKAVIKHQKAAEAERLKREREPKKSRGWSKGKIFGVALMFLLIIGIYGAWLYTQSSPSGNSNENSSSNGNSNVNGQKASVFTLTDIDGNVVSLETFLGKVVVLDFFYIRCGYCDDQFLELEEIYQSYSHDDVVIISISIDPTYDTIDRLEEFKTGPNQYSSLDYEISWILTRDTSDVSTMYGINAAPTSVIIDKEGFISPHSPFIGLTDVSQLVSEIDTLLNL